MNNQIKMSSETYLILMRSLFGERDLDDSFFANQCLDFSGSDVLNIFLRYKKPKSPDLSVQSASSSILKTPLLNSLSPKEAVHRLRWWDTLAGKMDLSFLESSNEPFSEGDIKSLPDACARFGSLEMLKKLKERKTVFSLSTLANGILSSSPELVVPWLMREGLDPSQPIQCVRNQSQISFPNALFFLILNLKPCFPGDEQEVKVLQKRLSLMSLLIEKGVPLSDGTDHLLVRLCAGRGQYNRSKILPLLKGYVDVNLPSDQGTSLPLLTAISLNDKSMVEWLVDQGADLDLANTLAETHAPQLLSSPLWALASEKRLSKVIPCSFSATPSKKLHL